MAVVDNFFGNPMPVTPAAKVAVGASAISNGVLTVGSQNSIVDGGAGAYTIIGGTGSDTYYINTTIGLTQGPTTGIDTVVAALDYVLPSNLTNLVLNGVFAGFGNSGANYIVGTGGSNLIDGGGGNDVLTGGSGTTYEFESGEPGYTLITDFVPGSNADGGKTDEVRLNGYSQFATFAEVQAAMTQVGSDVVLTLNSNTAIKFSNTQISQFSAANFELALSPSSYGAATFTSNFSPLSLWNGTTGVWATNYGWGGTANGLNVDSVLARSLPQSGEVELYVDPAMTGTGKTALGLNPYSVSNGVLTIHAGPAPAADVSSIWGYKFISGMISTRYTFTQTYGYFDAQMKLPAGQGNWPAFWLYAVNGSSELDVMENNNGSDEITGTAHNNGSGGAATGVKDYIPNLTSAFHNFGVLWTPQTITWYVDGVDIGSVATPSNMNGPMYMIANLGLNGSTPSNYAGGDLQIQYIHAYTLANSPVPAPTTTTTTPAPAPAPTPVTPSLTALSAALPSGATTLKTGATAQISLTFNENVTVTGAPTLQLSDGETATFVSGSGSNVLTFAYTASAGDRSSDLQVSGLNLTNGAKIADANGNSVGTLSGDLKISVAAAAPTVTSLAAVASGHTATLAEGQTATITVNLSEAVTVAGTPELQLSDWGVAKYVSGSGTNSLTFSYVGDPTQNTELHATGLVLPTGSSIQDSAGNALTTVTGDLGLWIASIQPYNLGITETTSTGTKYVHAGSTVTFTMTTTEAVTVAGKPTLTLNDGAAATYVSGSGTNTLTFSYLVQPGDTSKALGATGLSIGANASIVDAKGNPWNQQIGVFANTAIVVDTTPPTFVGVSLSPNAPTSVSTGQSEPLTVTLSEAVNVTGAPTLQLSDGESATYVSGSGTNSLTFSYSPTAGHATPDLQVTGLALPSGASIGDLAGNAVVGSLSGDLHLAVNEANAQIAYGTGVHDVFVLASQSEVVVEPAVNDGTAVLESSFSTTLPANITILKLEGTGNLTGTANNMNDFLYANSGNDVLVAEKGADTLVAGSGADTLVAGTGNDTMIGGTGADTFLFNKLVATQDVIQNFGAKDVINISTYLAAGLTPHLSDTAAGEIISFSNGASIELLGVHASQLVSTSVGYIHA